MVKSKKLTNGQELWVSLYQADDYDQETQRISVPTSATKPQRATRKWLEGMSRHLKSKFAPGLRLAREKAGITQLQLAKTAGLTTNAIAMIERGERTPTLDTAARICWALDMESGVTVDDLN